MDEDFAAASQFALVRETWDSVVIPHQGFFIMLLIVGEVTVCHRQLRVDVRTGDGSGTPLLMCGGIGTSVEVLQSLVDALDPGIDIIRFDAPGVGGSPVGVPAFRVPAAGLDAGADVGRAGLPPG